MSKKEIESKIAKYLRKANHLKSTQAKLERINELIDILRGISPLSSIEKGSHPIDTLQKETSVEYLENYLELCNIHKIKFQMDAVLSGVKDDINRLRQDPEQMSQDIFDSLMQRLQTVLEIDADHPEAQELIHILQTEYKQYAQNFEYPDSYFNIAQYQLPKLCIEIACNLQDVKERERLKATYKQYQVATQRQGIPENHSSTDNASLCRMRFSLEHLKDFEIFHEELRVKSSYKIAVNNRDLDEQSFSDWFQCYKRFLKANNPQYCYGASPFTFNFFGCHKLYLPDVAKQLEKCWFHYGTLDQDSGFFLVTKKPIVDQIRVHLEHCGFCSALTQEKLVVGMALIPKYINPECDSRWRYYYTQGKRTGVIPSGNDIAIATLNTPLKGGRGVSPLEGGKGVSHPEPSSLIEVGSTPYIHKILKYLESGDPSDLSEPAYRKLSTCMNCGAPYRLHTMTCSRCKIDFWKYALKDIESTLDRLRYVKKIKLQAHDLEITTPSPASVPPEEETVSFEQLWSDPQIQELLSHEQHAPETDSQEQEISRDIEQQKIANLGKKEAISNSLAGSPVARFPSSQTRSSDRFDLHKKIRRLVPKKYRERKAIEKAFSQPARIVKFPTPTQQEDTQSKNIQKKPEEQDNLKSLANAKLEKSTPQSSAPTSGSSEKAALISAVRSLKPRQKSELSKRGVVRVIYHATMDKETCPLCSYLDGMVMDPDDPATDIFSPPLYPGCTCSREYVLKTEKPKNWPKVTFKFPPEELLVYLDKDTKT